MPQCLTAPAARAAVLPYMTPCAPLREQQIWDVNLLTPTQTSPPPAPYPAAAQSLPIAPPAPDLGNSSYMIVPEGMHDLGALCLDSNGGDAQTLVTIQRCHDKSYDQLWLPVSAGGGRFYLKEQASGTQR
jgi:hypothetical protein